MNNSLKTVVIDDEEIARKGIIQYVEKVPFLELLGSYSNPFEFIENQHFGYADLLLIDIEMPGINGNDFLKTFRNAPLTIFITAYPQYAMEGYELDILDYLLKPVKFERFYKAVNKALDYNRKSNEPNQSEIWIKADNALHKLMINDIIMISSLQNYIRLHTRDKTYTLLSTLKEFKKQLPNEFIQCHKSFIVNKNHILRIEGNTVYLTQEEATISRNFRQEFITKVTQN